MRSSSLTLVGAAGLLLLSASGCRLEAHTQTQFEDATQPARTSVREWNGDAITVENDGINPLSGTGGVEVKVDPAAKKLTVEAIFAAYADDDKKSEADQSIKEAIASLTIAEDNGAFRIKCGHGKPHGSSSEAGSGCKILRVTIPSGSAAQPLDLTVGTGNGSIRVGLANAGDVPTVSKLLVDNNGLGEVDVRARPVANAAITVTGDDAVRVTLPSDFSTKKVAFSVDEADAAKAIARVITTDFPGMVSGLPFPTSGATSAAAESLSVTSTGPFSDDTITIAKF